MNDTNNKAIHAFIKNSDNTNNKEVSLMNTINNNSEVSVTPEPMRAFIKVQPTVYSQPVNYQNTNSIYNMVTINDETYSEVERQAINEIIRTLKLNSMVSIKTMEEDDLLIIAEIICKYNLFVKKGETLFFFNGKYFDAVVGEKDTRHAKFLHRLLKACFYPVCASITDYILKNIIYSCAIVETTYDSGTINFNNGIVDLNGRLYPHSPQCFHTGYVKANFIPNMSLNTPCFDKFLDDVCRNDYILKDRIWEFLGYLLSSNNNAKRIHFIYGQGDTGKSVFLTLINHLISPSNITNMAIDNLCRGNFSMSEIENKSICISSDESSSTLNANDISKLKRISGKDMITSDKKYCPQVSFLSNVKMIIASNYFIEATIADPAFERRRMTIPFQYPIPLEKQDSMLIYKLLNERDAIVTKAFYSYIRLLQQNFIFSGDRTFGGEYDRMHITHNIDGAIHEFVEKYCNTESDTFTPSNYIFEAFIKIYSSFTIQDSEVFFKKLNKFLNSMKIPHYKRRHPDFPNPVNGYFLTIKEV